MTSLGVTRAERQVVELAIALVDGSDARLIAPRLLREMPPTGLGSLAMEAIERVMSRGIARKIVQGGGPSPWKGAPPLRFGSATLDLLTWLHATPVAATQRKPLVFRKAPSPAEALLLTTVAEWLGTLGADPPAPIVENPWVWLLVGGDLAPRAKVPALDWKQVTDNQWLVSALGPRFKAAWVGWNRTTRGASVLETIQHGEAQEALFQGFLQAVPVTLALPLAAALIEVARLDLGVWEVERGTASVSQWQRARRARVAMVRVASAWLGKLEQQLRSIGFVDDGFEQAQKQLRLFEDAFLAIRRTAPALMRSEELPV